MAVETSHEEHERRAGKNQSLSAMSTSVSVRSRSRVIYG
jgi:hypothetical protein